MSSFTFLLVLSLVALAACRPDIADRPEARDGDAALGRSGATDGRKPIIEYLLSQASSRNNLPPGGKREITHFQTFPAITPNPHRPNIITGPPKTANKFHRDPNKSPYENFNGFILAGRKPEENLVESPALSVSDSEKVPTPNRTFTKVDVIPAIATIINTYDEHGTLRASLTRYEPAGAANPATASAASVPSSGQTRQQISWPYASYFPILIKDPFLTAFNTLAAGNSFSFSSLVEYGPEADICRARESTEDHEVHKRRARATKEDESEANTEDYIKRVMAAEEVGKRQVMAKTIDEMQRRRGRRTKVTVADPEKGMASIRVDSPDSDRDSYFQADDIEARANVANLILPPLSTILMPPVTGYDERKKKPTKPDKEENSEEESVGEQEEAAGGEEPSDGVAINPPPEGASVAEAKPVGLAIAGPGGVASSKPVAQAIVGPGGLAIARPVATAIAGVDVGGTIPIGGQQQQLKKPQKKKPKQEYDNDPDTELQYVGGLSGPIGSPKPKHTPPQTNYIGGLRGTVGHPIPKHESPGPSGRQSYLFKLGQAGGKYGFFPFLPAEESQGRTMEKRMDTPTYFHGMIGAHGQNMPASVYPLVYY